VGDEAEAAGAPYDPRWLHLEDAAQALALALTVPLQGAGEHASGALNYGWWLYHVPGGGASTRFPLGPAGAPPAERGLGYAPRHAFPASPGAGEPPPWAREGPEADGAAVVALDPPAPVGGRPVRSVVVFGAGGPLAAAAARALAPAYRLRLTDLRPLAELEREGRPQSPGAPLPAVLGPPHEAAVVDVADPAQVRAACAGMDAVVNCTVVRPDPVQAFRVNTLGAIHVLQAAAAHGIRRVVHTGPQLVTDDSPAGYWWDTEVPDDSPGRPGTSLYGHSKYLGQEAARAFAEHYGLEVPALYFSIFVNPETASAREGGVFPMTVSWEDAGLAVRRAVEAPALPRRLEVLHILADLPHGKYSNAKARRLLGWQPRDSLAHLWARRPAPPRGE
jgi:nucleoside-diphosphate-sugar epimerase